jgi:hypothetical protein
MSDCMKNPTVSGFRRAGIAALMAAALAGCSTQGTTNEERMGSFVTAPGKYQFYTCAHLVQTAAAARKREAELEALIARAESGAGGGFVSAIAYRPELLQVRGNLAEVRREEAAKNCPPQVAASPVRPTPPGPPRRR